MSGLKKQKKYDWKDSNLAMFGSDTEKSVKKGSAETEPAWSGVGNSVGLRVWRIVKFKVEEWPKEDNGKFYNGDSYIVLNTYKEDGGDELKFDVHFWIGRFSTQDEYGTAAYKTVELDTFLDDAAVQHRETQGHESDLFTSYFKSITFRCEKLYSRFVNLDEYATTAYKTVELDTFLDDQAVQHRETEGHESDLFLSYFKSVMIMKGGADTGFRKVKPEEYKPRLLHVNRTKRVTTVNEVPCCKEKLNSDDVFILDLGRKLYQWNGKTCNKDERFKAAQLCQQIEGERGRCETEVLDQDDIAPNHEFYEKLTGDMEDDDDEDEDEDETTALFRVSDESGKLEMSKVKDGDVAISDFQAKDPPPKASNGCLACVGGSGKKSKRTKVSKDVFLLETSKECFVWIGSGASVAEKKNGFSYAHTHLMKGNKPYKNVTVLKEGQRCPAFSTALAA